MSDIITVQLRKQDIPFIAAAIRMYTDAVVNHLHIAKIPVPPVTETPEATITLPVKRGRGRPRKHPAKVAKNGAR